MTESSDVPKDPKEKKPDPEKVEQKRREQKDKTFQGKGTEVKK